MREHAASRRSSLKAQESAKTNGIATAAVAAAVAAAAAAPSEITTDVPPVLTEPKEDESTFICRLVNRRGGFYGAERQIWQG